jgi:hypothetical protein
MSGTQRSPALAGYRDAVSERIEASEPFGAVEDAINEAADLTRDEEAALWLLAFSLRDPAEQQLDARAHPASPVAMGDGKLNGQARPRDLGEALAAALKEHPGAERYQRRQRPERYQRRQPQMPGVRAGAADRPRPLEFDADGFPVPQRIPSFVTRVAQLRSPS